MPGRIELRLAVPRRDALPRKRRGAMRLLVMGDFSGQLPSERPVLAQRPTQQVDLDNLDTVFGRLAPRLVVEGRTLGFASIDDFHPDRLYQRLDVFSGLRQARAQPPEVAGEWLAGLLGKGAAGAGGANGPNHPGGPGARSAPAQALALGAGPSAGDAGFEAFIRSLVAPHIVAESASGTRTYLAAVDDATAEQMRALLRRPELQTLEAAWRGVAWLIKSVELGEELELHLFDVSRDELLADIAGAQGRLAETGLHRALADRWRNVPDGDSWSAIAGLYRFGASDTDIGLLAALGLIASQAGGPFLAEANQELTVEEPPASWVELRHSEAAPWIGLAAPRVLLRQPYGKRSDPIDAFAFEEFAGAVQPESLLWGNPALALLLLIGRAFLAKGWDFEPGDDREIGDLPAVTIEHDGERELVPCAERLLSEKVADTMLGAGLMPLVSHKHRNAVTVLRFQSIAEPAHALAGLGLARG